MELEQGYRYPSHNSIGYPLQQYHYNARNTALSIPNGARLNARVCPMRGQINGSRPQMRGGREEDNETGQARRRVAIACARCRKRKIRCSGDPGDGTGCQNCNSAGVDPTLCAFHRVGSGEPASMIDLHNLNQIAHSQAMMMYNPPTSPVRSRPLSYPHGLNTKSIYHQTAWYNSPYNSEETSPVEAYGLDQPTSYLPNQTSIACNSTYDWSADSKSALNGYIGHDSGMYRTQTLPYMHHNIRTAASSEALSNSMTSLQLTIPERPNTRSGLPASQRPQLPIPQPSPAQASKNVVDQLQDQLLRSAQAMGGSSINNGGFVKPPPPFHSDVDVQITATTEALAAQMTSTTPVSTADSTTCYPNVSCTEELPISPAPHFNFNTSPLFEAVPASTRPSYSNFRDSQDYSKPAISSPTETKTSMVRQMSQKSLYSIGSGSNSRNSSGANGSTLVSGHRYTPLSHSQSQSQHQATLKGLANKSMYSIHRPSTAVGNRSF